MKIFEKSELTKIAEKYKQWKMKVNKEKICPHCQHRNGFSIFNSKECKSMVCGQCFNEYVEVVQRRIEFNKLPYAYPFFNCKSLNMMLNEKNFSKTTYCKDWHEFSYFKLRTFMDQIVYFQDETKIFMYEQVWPNKCLDHQESVAAKVDKERIKCLHCDKQFHIDAANGEELNDLQIK
mmetsp:Transcript_27693/g.26718  ORF Transcript_27693/g.26718 Transcript_27693/m.26718 type:complete len:178 (+) Transcript_27693:1601-2134(+)|eukprot:CAMPEP_0170555378 /NCGR_PEP_ID=MMETSP0211-20121228/13272_1 /TAXON_ID=311385 /ORGANISM="Pseudokeronopsis sp., Strain OXSARD2" /LENGTH=177 /DNA_ID=CAMNT_0010865177 /DNA_START=1550 /DNA_END=2083 /DNA_ORIENTATION=+